MRASRARTRRTVQTSVRQCSLSPHPPRGAARVREGEVVKIVSETSGGAGVDRTRTEVQFEYCAERREQSGHLP